MQRALSAAAREGSRRVPTETAAVQNQATRFRRSADYPPAEASAGAPLLLAGGAVAAAGFLYSQKKKHVEQDGFSLPSKPSSVSGLAQRVLENQAERTTRSENLVECKVAGNVGKTNWDNVRKDVIELLEAEEHMEEPLGPILVRLAWHSSGTWCYKTKTGGSDGATMRFESGAEAKWGANAGLAKARKVLQVIIGKYPNASIADIWIFAGTVALEEMSGNRVKIGFKEGRLDKTKIPDWETKTAPDGRLPDADKGNMSATAKHLRLIFHRQGFSDQEIVALSGAHALGRTHTTSSGYSGPWTFSPTVLNNEYFRLLKEEKWSLKKWSGPEQYEDRTGELMMLPSDIALLFDGEFKKWVEVYYKDEERFYKDFGKACRKLFDNGVPFKDRHGLGPISGLFCGVPEHGAAPAEDL
ncbi:unnamed protein product [Amoebophrya sp. A25]|nr:unnamed protein product [Amoebophrya sp. A25]|eukprot:GSA25T00002064001.1